MELFEKIFEAYPELQSNRKLFMDTIILQDDSDGVGAYIAKWEYEQPIPEGLTLGKPSA